MKHSARLMTSAIAGVLALGATTASTALAADKQAMEKCYGIAKAGKNDCQTASSACAGTSPKDGQADAWILIPKGTCDKIVGGSTSPKG